MSESSDDREGRPLQRVAAIALTDCKFRFRKTSGLILLLGIAAGVYLIVPDIRSGKTLLDIDKHRVIANSSAVAVGTGMFCSIATMAVHSPIVIRSAIVCYVFQAELISLHSNFHSDSVSHHSCACHLEVDCVCGNTLVFTSRSVWSNLVLFCLSNMEGACNFWNVSSF